MTRRVLANTIYLECLAFAITALLAASGVEGRDGGKEQPREINRIVHRATYNSNSPCYNSQNQEVKCSKKKGIIVGSVIGTIFVFLGGLYLYGMWSERRKKRGGSSTAEENTLLSDGSETVSDCEKGVTKASKNKNKNKNKKNENDGDHVTPPLPHLYKSEEASVSEESSIASDLPAYSYDKPPGIITQTDTPRATSDPGRTPLTKPQV